MKQITIGLVMEDREYALALARRLASIKKGLLAIVLDDFKEDFKEAEPFDLILTEGNKDYPQSEKKVHLSATPEKKNIEKMTLFKYQGSKSLLGELLFLLSKEESLFYENDEESALTIGFYSNEGGSGVSSIALTCAYQLAAYHNLKVIYLNIEAMNSSVRYLQEGDLVELKLLLYLLKTGRKMELSKYIHEADGFDYFQGNEVNHFSIFYPENINFLLNNIKKTMDYQVIVLDMGSGSEIVLESIKTLCDESFFVAQKNIAGSLLENQRMENLIINRISLDKQLEGCINIHEDKGAFVETGEKTEIDKYSLFASEVKAITNLIAAKVGDMR